MGRVIRGNDGSNDPGSDEAGASADMELSINFRAVFRR
jgi:hypothetical protein